VRYFIPYTEYFLTRGHGGRGFELQKYWQKEGSDEISYSFQAYYQTLPAMLEHILDIFMNISAEDKEIDGITRDYQKAIAIVNKLSPEIKAVFDLKDWPSPYQIPSVKVKKPRKDTPCPQEAKLNR
jgi:hypothetical protein